MKPLSPEIAYSRATVRSWERLRLIYNGILLVPGVLLIWRTLTLQATTENLSVVPIGGVVELIAQAVVFGVVANICYCLGPYVEFVLGNR